MSSNVYKIYNSLSQLVKDIDISKVTEFYARRGVAIKDSVQYKNAAEIMLTGDPKSARLIKDCEKTARLKSNGQTARNTIYSAQQGFVPNMGRVMAGHPDNMINIRRQIVRNTKVLNIMYNCAIDYSVDKDKIAYEGARLLSGIRQLEKNGYRVNLYIACIAKFDKSKNSAVFAVKAKDDGKPVNITRLAFPLVNDMFLRKIIIALIECTGAEGSGHGVPLIKDDAKKMLKNGDRRFIGYYYIDFYQLAADKRPVHEILKENII